MIIDFSDKNILITGATSGIGFTCVSSLLDQGATVIALGRKIEKLSARIKKDNQKLLIYKGDLTDEGFITELFDDLSKKSFKIDGFIHSAGIELILPVSATKIKHYKDIFDINVFTGIEFIRILSSARFCPNDGASYILISSIMGIVGNEGLSAYSATKGALISVVKSISIELARKKIRINSISPGFVETEMFNKSIQNASDQAIQSIKNAHPLGLGKPENIADLCSFLLSEKSSWITGTNIVIDGGYTAR